MSKFFLRFFIVVYGLSYADVALAYCSHDQMFGVHPKHCVDGYVCAQALKGNKSHLQEAKNRGLTCSNKNGPDLNFSNTKQTKKIKSTPLRTAFISLPKTKREIIQINLAHLELYTAAIDGLYGKGTEAGLKEFNAQHFNNSNLKNQKNVEGLLTAVMYFRNNSETEETSDVKKPPAENPEVYNVASGSGFYVSDEGHIITNHHVIDGCKVIRAHIKGEELGAVKIAEDQVNDLALLKISETPAHIFPLSNSSPFPLQDIIVAGYPFGEDISNTIKFTKGIVSSLAGIGNNFSEMQIDAALQPGNSGGPIIDEKGNIIGVAVAKLDLAAVLEDYGVVPENTNFGVKVSAVKNLLEGNGVSFLPPNEGSVSKSELSKNVTSGTLYLSCWMTKQQIKKMLKSKVMFKKFEEN
jgi:S1-C subfamily serine protease